MKALAIQRGSSAVELALVLLCLVMMIAPLTLFGRLFWRYGVLKSACQQGANMVATAPPYSFAVTATRSALVAAAKKAVEDAAVAGGANRDDIAGLVEMSCDGGGSCGSNSPPSRISMSFTVLIGDPILPDLNVRYMPTDSYELDIRCEAPYASTSPVEVAP